MKLVTRSFAVVLGGGLGAGLAYTALQLFVQEGLPSIDRAYESWKGYRAYVRDVKGAA
jgi:hypothetical protein